MENIYIIMATYNGAKYIESQIKSIQAQTYKDWVLIVQDDGSTDETVELIQEMKKKDSRINITTNSSEYHGAFENFYTLINKVKKVILELIIRILHFLIKMIFGMKTS